MGTGDPPPVAGESSSVGVRLEIGLCGPMRLCLDGVAVDAVQLRRSKVRAFVAMLALAPGHRLRRERLADAIWPDLDGDGAANQLSKAVHLVRRALEPDLAPRAPSRFLLIRDGIVELTAPGGLVVDVNVFRDRARAALAGDDRAMLFDAVAHIPAELLSDEVDSTWATAIRSEMQSLSIRVLEQAAASAETAGDVQSAEALHRRVLESEPASETAHRGLMRVAWSRGDRTEALRRYSACRSALREELDVDPDAETIALAERIARVPAIPETGAGATGSRENPRPPMAGDPVAEVPGSEPVLPTRTRLPHRLIWQAAASVLLVAITVVFVAATPPGRIVQRSTRAAVRSTIAFVTGQPATPPLVVLTGSGVAPYSRVDVVGSRSGLAAFADEDGRFALPGVWWQPGQVYRIAVSSDGLTASVVDVTSTASVVNGGTVDVGVLPVPAFRTIALEDVGGLNSVAYVHFPDVGDEYSAGIVRALTVTSHSDAERVSAIDAFVASLYSPTVLERQTPRAAIDGGAGRASDLSDTMAALARVAGYQARLVDVAAPANPALTYPLVEVFYDGAWHVFDPAAATTFRAGDGTVPSFAEVRNHPSYVRLDPASNRTFWNATWLMHVYESPLHRYRVVEDSNTLEI